MQPERNLQNPKHPTDQLKWDREQTQDGTSEDHGHPIQQEHDRNKGENDSLLSKCLHGCHEDNKRRDTIRSDDRWKCQWFESQSQGWHINRRMMLEGRKRGL